MSLISDLTKDIFGHDGLTVPQASGLIAAGVFVGECSMTRRKVICSLTGIIVQYVVPLALPIILLGLIKEKDTLTTAPAVTWYVSSPDGQLSLMTTGLLSDSFFSPRFGLRSCPLIPRLPPPYRIVSL